MYYGLLSEWNIVAVQRNHPDEWRGAYDSTPPTVDRRSGKRMFTEDERRRLATLAILVSKGVVSESRPRFDQGDERKELVN
jgi:hypothetical protein